MASIVHLAAAVHVRDIVLVEDHDVVIAFFNLQVAHFYEFLRLAQVVLERLQIVRLGFLLVAGRRLRDNLLLLSLSYGG